jgi:DNA-binding response OmpR family regulator
MPSSVPGPGESEGGRIGGARADFVGSLGRKVSDARELLAALEEDPSARPEREELRRRLHAIGAGARMLRFEALTGSLQEALAVLDRGAVAGALREQDVGFVARVLDDLPALAWAEVPSRTPEARDPDPAPADAAGPLAVAVLVFGEESFAQALPGRGEGSRGFECESTLDADLALELARAHAPDVLLIDADLPRAAELVEALLDDPLTEPVPVVVIGTFPSGEAQARFVALGVARTLQRPLSAEDLRRVCSELIDSHTERTVRVTLGEPTIEQLADRLAEELKRALVEGVDRPLRSRRIPLGEGTEVLGAMWGAIARIQEIVTQRTDGVIRFGGDAPEGAIAVAPWMPQESAGADRTAARGRGAAADVQLNGRVVVVADDDPGVTWFVSDLLRTAGCAVHEALDGATALQLSFRVQPDLVVSDILMPGLDGFALCRALRRDVSLRDTPVILLSWKEDLLQRVRELGASAAAYMRKESGSRAILARVREVLRPRARVESRLRVDGEVRGRLDGLTPRTLLHLVCAIRKDARLSVRDATYLYEVEIRGGAPRRATRTASNGNFRSGEVVLASLLGVGAGRFVVAPSVEPIRAELTGTLADQLLRPVALARGALSATTGGRTMGVERILFDEEALEEYLHATPEPMRALIRRWSDGVTPRQMLLAGDVSPSLVEDVLADLAARGAIRAVIGPNGLDLLTPAVEAALSARPGRGESEGGPAAPSPASGTPPTAVAERASLARRPVSASPRGEAGASSLEDAVMREISERASEPRVPTVPARDPPHVEPSAPRQALPASPAESPAVPTIADRPATPQPQPAAPPADPDDRGDGAAAGLAEAFTPPSTNDDAADDPTARDAPEDHGTGDPTEGGPTVAPAPEPPPRGKSRALLLVSLGLGATALAGVVFLMTGTEQPEPPSAAPTLASTPLSASPSTPSPTPVASAAVANAVPSVGEDLPPGAEVPLGFGMIDVGSLDGSVVLLDGKPAGSGALVSSPGHHELRVRLGGSELTQVVEVRAGKVTRLRSTSSP